MVGKARNAAELMTLSAELQASGIQLELLTGPLTGIYDPNSMGAMFFAVLAVAGQIERNYIREKTGAAQVRPLRRHPPGLRLPPHQQPLILRLALWSRSVGRRPNFSPCRLRGSAPADGRAGCTVMVSGCRLWSRRRGSVRRRSGHGCPAVC